MRRHCEGDRDRDGDDERDRDAKGMHRKALFLLHMLDQLDILKSKKLILRWTCDTFVEKVNITLDV